MRTPLSGTQDLQASAPAFAISLSGVGVTGVRRAATLAGGRESIVSIDATVDLDAARKGVHMSRFHETISAAIDEALNGPGQGPDHLAARIATAIVTRQDARCAAVTVRGEVELNQRTPASSLASREPVSVAGHAHVDVVAGTARQALEVTAIGMNACPCAQGMVREQALLRLLEAGFDQQQADLALELVPIATHNQRGTGTLIIGSDQPLDVAQLAEIVRGAMSARIHELLKRPDELHVVEQAHANPRFVEDCVRAMLAGALASSLPLADSDLLWARQVNHESIHAHDVVAERGGLVGGLRAELAGTTAAGRAALSQTPERWLAGDR